MRARWKPAHQFARVQVRHANRKDADERVEAQRAEDGKCPCVRVPLRHQLRAAWRVAHMAVGVGTCDVAG